jgi:hypothetical protein
MFDQNNRAPLGPEFNPTTTNGDLIRPEVSFSEHFLSKLAILDSFVCLAVYHHAVAFSIHSY